MDRYDATRLQYRIRFAITCTVSGIDKFMRTVQRSPKRTKTQGICIVELHTSTSDTRPGPRPLALLAARRATAHSRGADTPVPTKDPYSILHESFRAKADEIERPLFHSTPTRGKLSVKVSCVRKTRKSMATKLERAQRGCHAATVVSVLVRILERPRVRRAPSDWGTRSLPSRAHCALALAGAARGLSRFPNSIWRSWEHGRSSYRA